MHNISSAASMGHLSLPNAAAAPQDMAARKFARDGDVATAHDLVLRSDGIARARDMAVVQAELAMAAAARLMAGPERDALVALAARVVDRQR